MNAVPTMKWLNYVVSGLILIFGFLLFYDDTQEWIGSLFAASLSAALAFCSFVMLRWLIQVFLK